MLNERSFVLAPSTSETRLVRRVVRMAFEGSLEFRKEAARGDHGFGAR